MSNVFLESIGRVAPVDENKDRATVIGSRYKGVWYLAKRAGEPLRYVVVRQVIAGYIPVVRSERFASGAHQYREARGLDAMFNGEPSTDGLHLVVKNGLVFLRDVPCEYPGRRR